MRKITDYWLAQLLIFILLTTLPLVALSVVDAIKILVYTHDWLIFVIMNLLVLHFIARKQISKHKSASNFKKIYTSIIIIILMNLALIIPLYLLSILWGSDTINKDKLFHGLIFTSINIHFVWCFGYQMALSAREKSRLEIVHQKLSLKILAQQIQPDFLYQSLDNIEVLIEQDEDLACDAITNLAELLRYKLKASKLECVNLGEELTAVSYMQHLAHQGEVNMIDLASILEQKINVPPLCIYQLVTLLNQKIETPLTISLQVKQDKWYLHISGVLSSPRLIRRKITKQYESFFRLGAEFSYIDQNLILSAPLDKDLD
ncbi:histidine kinase [Pseudoalteromonas denitrificans]|uniref:Histidine kinase n=1 Tax=Pseudoalteromonas denitrificans DSM 6059 TaxID=1123010 RepID=A0A1I1RZF2_9GAMM|nr:sensor histidine kinase [Pseudoalteromonas denitrificans]SFD39709.1 Histidine kinase [Pseudoalteromonas denitrificans DSM 6059]